MTKPIRRILRVPAAHVDYAKSLDAKSDPKNRVMYIDGEVPPGLADYAERPPRNRDYTLEVSPSCPLCSCKMELRSSVKGRDFWGCSMYLSPKKCKGYRAIEDQDITGDEVRRTADGTIRTNPSIGPTELDHEPSSLLDAQTRVINSLTRYLRDASDVVPWLSTSKVGLGYRVPLELMVGVEGCDEVAVFIERTFGAK